MNGKTGIKLWDFPILGGGVSAPAIGFGNEIYSGSKDGRIYSIDSKTGDKIWDYKTTKGWLNLKYLEPSDYYD